MLDWLVAWWLSNGKSANKKRHPGGCAKNKRRLSPTRNVLQKTKHTTSQEAGNSPSTCGTQKTWLIGCRQPMEMWWLAVQLLLHQTVRWMGSIFQLGMFWKKTIGKTPQFTHATHQSNDLTQPSKMSHQKTQALAWKGHAPQHSSLPFRHLGLEGWKVEEFPTPTKTKNFYWSLIKLDFQNLWVNLST